MPDSSHAQQLDPGLYDYPQNHLEWYTIDSEHFMIHFQEGNSRPAQVISRIAEEIYKPITALYDHYPDQKVSILLNDRFDYSNGAAFFYDNKIEIWLPALGTPLRGTHSWLRNVITHEFTHMVQIQASMKQSRRHPATYLQWLSYEDVRRPDVLYGFPTGFISYPLSGVSIPAWLAEGTAQFMREDIFYDDWDNIRDMILRTRILENTQLSLEAMGTFGSKTSIEREVTYNQGFAFTKYIADRFGEQSIADLSKAFSQRGVYDVRKAIEIGTGVDGDQVYEDWIADLKVSYTAQMNNVELTKSSKVEDKGFFNFYPAYSPDGKKVAYLSNRGRQDAMVSLYLKDLDGGDTQQVYLDKESIFPKPHSQHDHGQSAACNLSFDINQIRAAFSYSPDGDKIAFSRNRLNKLGESYNDLYIYDLEDESDKRLTTSKRIHEPSWSPDGENLAAAMLHDGTMNLVSYNLNDEAITTYTDFHNGEQIYRPVWHPNGVHIYYAFSDTSHRSIYRYNISSGHSTLILGNDDVDFRDPYIEPNGEYLYYSADVDGIFNIHRLELATGKSEQMTSVEGGAFMPAVNTDGHLLFSEYVSDGYKISSSAPEDLLYQDISVKSGMITTNHNSKENTNKLNFFNDKDITSLGEEAYALADTSSYSFSLDTRGQDSHRSFRRYTDEFISFSFYPVLRFDNYTTPNGSNSSLLKDGRFGSLGQNLWRDSKMGFYLSSRDVLERLSFFGGFMVGPGSRETDGLSNFFKPSRLVNLDRDGFLSIEYAGLPFIKRHWSPTLSVSVFNLKRNVSDGLEIEDYACTACLPDSTTTDIAYYIFQVEISLLSKLNRFSLVELGYHYSPYRVSTEPFYSREFQQQVPGSTARYYIGSTMTAAYHIQAETPHRHSDVAPIGLEGNIRYSYQPSSLLDSYDITDGTLVPVYKDYKNHSFEFDARLGFRKFGQNFSFSSRFFSYLNPPGDTFFLDYIGGLPAMRSYPFFALGGTTTAYSQLSWYLPLVTGIEKQYGRLTPQKIFLRLFAEAGNGWGSDLNTGNNIKKGVGAELRFSLNSYYLFPTRFFISGAYGFDRFDMQLPEDFITTGESDHVSYGGELLFNFGLLFDFDI
ncbi:MAG: hypothetical protein WED82_05010 [Balneolales bacterium]